VKFSTRLFGGLLCLLLTVPGGWLASPAWSQSQGAPKARPALYEFGAGHCFSCKEMEKIMAEIRGRYGEHLEVRMVYAGKEDELFKQYKIMLIPTQIFLDAAGKEVDRHIGPLSRDEVVKKLRNLKFIKE
jgi:thioredoxin 1